MSDMTDPIATLVARYSRRTRLVVVFVIFLVLSAALFAYIMFKARVYSELMTRAHPSACIRAGSTSEMIGFVFWRSTRKKCVWR